MSGSSRVDGSSSSSEWSEWMVVDGWSGGSE